MRRLFFAAAAATVSFGLATAQEKQTKPVPKPPVEKQDDEKKELTKKEKLAEIQKALAKKRSELAREINAMNPGKERNDAIKDYNNAGAPFAKQALDLAKEDPKDPVAQTAVQFAIQSAGTGKTSIDAVTFFVENFEDAKVSGFVSTIAQINPDALRVIAEKTKSKDVKAIVFFTMADTEVDNIDYPRTGIALPPEEAAAKLKIAAGKLEKLAAESGNVKVTSRLGKTIAEAAEKKLFFINNLTVGKKAPEFTCDLLEDGKKAKLSDYKGNVVVLDVWATWCGPCKAMIPHERELVEKMKSKPFKLVSLSADDKKETLTKFLETEEMPWTHMWNGGAKGNFLEQYQIRFYPTIYVLDAKGIIRFKHVRGEKMDHAVETLLKEMSAASE